MAAGTRHGAFGLEVRGEGVELPLFADVDCEGRRLDLRFEPDAAPRLGFPVGEPISDERDADGGVLVQIDRDAEAGYLIWGCRYGANRLRGDGRAVRCRPGRGGYDSWLRLLVAQVLPFAALLQGLEVFHAAAVVHAGAAIALVGRSGAGKSTLAAALHDRGDGFLADDVLAVELCDRAVIAHPGAAARTAAGSREELVGVPGEARAAPLAALCFLDRRADGPAEPRILPLVDPRVLLAATFNAVVDEPRRLATQLEICARLAQGSAWRLEAAPSIPPGRLARALHAKLAEG